MGAMVEWLDPALLERNVDSFVIDSREVSSGDVFFALSQPDYKNNGFNGEFEDATKYVPGAFANGAAACVVRFDRFEEHRESLAGFAERIIRFEDPIVALQNLAREVYSRWGKPVIAITGSAGKTTAKELTALVLEAGGRKVLKNRKNFNNGLGHPLTVLELAKDDSYDIAVLEMGMSTPMHEIQRLCRITPPDVSVELNVLPVHLEHLGTIENIAMAKAELVQGMKPGGIAVLNADDPRVLAMKEFAKGRVITFGLGENAEVRADAIEFVRFGETRFRLVLPGSESVVSFRLSGRHNVSNALAGAAVGHAFGMNAGEIAEQLARAVPPAQRGEVLHFRRGFTVVNDSYNSNPDALKSMIETLVEGGTAYGRKIVVAGEMLELGENAEKLHYETGKYIASTRTDVLIGVRGLAKALVDGARDAGLSSAEFAADSTEAGRRVAEIVETGDLILVKGSRGVKTEKVVEKLTEDFELEERSDRAARG